MVIQIFFHDQAYPAEHKGYVRTRTDLEPQVCHFRFFGSAGINDNQFCALFFCTHHLGKESGGFRL